MSSEDWFLRDPEPVFVEGFGMSSVVPRGWDCRIGRRFESGEGERAFPVLHAATIPLTGLRADYGGGVVEMLGTNDVFVALIEFGAGEAGSALFTTTESLPTLEVGDFHRNQLQRRIRGQAGVQRFFTLRGRPFCMYIVLGSIANARSLVEKSATLIRGVTVEAI